MCSVLARCSLSTTEKQHGLLQRTSLPSPRCVSITWMCILTLFLIWKKCIYTIKGKRQLVLSMASTVWFSWSPTLLYTMHLMSRCCLHFMHVGVAWSWAKEKEFGKVLHKKSHILSVDTAEEFSGKILSKMVCKHFLKESLESTYTHDLQCLLPEKTCFYLNWGIKD